MATTKKPAATDTAVPAKTVAKPASVMPAAPKAAAKKAPVAKKSAATTAQAKPAPAKPAAVAKAPAKKVAAVKKAAPAKALKAVTPEQRANYIEVAAFYIAERRGFAPGNPEEDYLNAAAEIDRLIAQGHFGK